MNIAGSDARIDRIESRQEDLIRSVDKQTEVIKVLAAQMAELVAWTQTPPSTDLGDTLRELLAGQQAMHGTLVHLGNEVRALPGLVSKILSAHSV